MITLFNGRLGGRCAMCHTNKVSDYTTLDFVPTGLEAACALFHYFGMLGTSEAAAESVGGILKRYAHLGLSTGRVVESTVLRWNNVRGTGSEDAFLQMCWAKFFGGASPKQYRFEYKGRFGKRRAKLQGGSNTLHRRLREAATSRWTTRDLRLAAHGASASGSPWQGGTSLSLEWKRKLAATKPETESGLPGSFAGDQPK